MINRTIILAILHFGYNMSLSSSFMAASYCTKNIRVSTPAFRLFNSYGPQDADFFLDQVETTVQNVLKRHGSLESLEGDKILEIPNQEREVVGVARHLNTRLQNLRRNKDCPRCWMQQAHCICRQCPPVEFHTTQINRLFLLMHHKEIAMKVDTAKLLLAAFPAASRLVVAGIGPDHQESMKEMLEAINDDKNRCLVLFPDDTAKPINEITGRDSSTNSKFDLIVIDGTWAQARKIHSRYIPLEANGGPIHVQLSQQAVETLEEAGTNAAHQLRRHATHWRQVGTFEATRLFLRDLDQTKSLGDSVSEPVWKQIQEYQEIANQAAKRELGPPRISKNV